MYKFFSVLHHPGASMVEGKGAYIDLHNLSKQAMDAKGKTKGNTTLPPGCKYTTVITGEYNIIVTPLALITT